MQNFVPLKFRPVIGRLAFAIDEPWLLLDIPVTLLVGGGRA